jgi:hypothetical protein
VAFWLLLFCLLYLQSTGLAVFQGAARIWIALAISIRWPLRTLPAYFFLFASMSGSLKVFYPITAVFNISGYYEASAANVAISCASLLVCVGIAALLLAGLSKKMQRQL